MHELERELKLTPCEAGLLHVIESRDQFGPFTVRSRHSEQQRNAFYDTASRSLTRNRVGFRKRIIEGQPLATWSIKGPSNVLRGVASRSEIEVQLDADMAPALALSALRQAARSRGAAALADAVDDALSARELPLARPILESVTDRRVLDLESPSGEKVELALDRVQLIGHNYSEFEIEAELKVGDESALDIIRDEIARIGDATASKGSKLSRALAHLATCACAATR